MPLELTQLKERLEKRPKKAEIAAASSFDNRVRFNVEPTLTINENRHQRDRFLKWVAKLVHKDALSRFSELLQPPYPTVSLFDGVFAALAKVMDGKDAVFRSEFSSDTAREDWSNYQSKVAADPHSFIKRVFDRMRSSINSVLIVDMERDSSDPYYYFLDIDALVDYEVVDGVVQWVVFREDKETLIVIDDVSYQVYKTQENAFTNLREEVVNPHDLGYCPAAFMWSEEVSSKSAIKRHPVTSYLSFSEWFLFMAIAKRYLDTYGSVPIFWGYDAECGYEHEGVHCEGGYLVGKLGPMVRDGDKLPCPSCSQRKLGPGTFISVPEPDEEVSDMRDPVGVIDIPINGLTYTKEEVERLAMQIYEGITGYGGEPVKNQAINIEQVLASIDSRRSVLVQLKGNIEKITTWMTETMCRLKYGSGFTYAYSNCGTQFYFFEPQQLLEIYQNARDQNADDMVLDQLQDEYLDAKHRSSPEDRMKAMILVNLDPFRHRTREEVSGMPVSEDEKLLKMNFSSFVQRFERENIDLITFGSLLEFDVKIKKIKEVLMTYVSDMKTGGGSTAIEDDLSRKSQLDAYGVAVRAGAITPQKEDEDYFRGVLDIPGKGEEVEKLWDTEGGVRRPITLAKEEEGQPLDFE